MLKDQLVQDQRKWVYSLISPTLGPLVIAISFPVLNYYFLDSCGAGRSRRKCGVKDERSFDKLAKIKG
jgi:hypothetical protein